jgi:hypothetical protein
MIAGEILDGITLVPSEPAREGVNIESPSTTKGWSFDQGIPVRVVRDRRNSMRERLSVGFDPVPRFQGKSPLLASTPGFQSKMIIKVKLIKYEGFFSPAHIPHVSLSRAESLQEAHSSREKRQNPCKSQILIANILGIDQI